MAITPRYANRPGFAAQSFDVTPTDVLAVLTTDQRPARVMSEHFQEAYSRPPSIHLRWRVEHSLQRISPLEAERE